MFNAEKFIETAIGALQKEIKGPVKVVVMAGGWLHIGGGIIGGQGPGQ